MTNSTITSERIRALAGLVLASACGACGAESATRVVDPGVGSTTDTLGVASRPGHETILFSEGGRLHAIAPDGSNDRRLPCPGRHCGEAAASPDGERLAVGVVGARGIGIWVMDADGANPRALTDSVELNAFVSWSPDGKRVMYESTTTLYTWSVGLDGSAWRMTPPGAGDERSDEQGPAWSPDGHYVAFDSRRASQGNDPLSTTFDLFLAPVDPLTGRRTGSGLLRLTASGPFNGGAAWSPDSRRIAFERHEPPGRLPQIYVVNVDGTGLHRLTPDSASTRGQEYSATWSRDGRRIAYVRRDASGVDVFVMNSDGSGAPANVTRTPGVPEELPRWGAIP